MRVGSSLAGVLAATGVVRAHGGEADGLVGAVPLEGFLAGVVATAVVALVVAGWRAGPVPTLSRPVISIPAWLTRVLYAGGRTVFTLYLFFALYRGLVGSQAAAENVATLFVWPVWITGLGLFAIALGSPWRAISPWRGLHALLERLEGSTIRARQYPARFGVWPAVLGFVVVLGVVANLTVLPSSPAATVGFVAAYTAVMLAGSLVFGAAWFQHADVLEVLYAQFARLAPIRTAAEDGVAWTVSLRSPWTGCLDGAPTPGVAPFAVAVAYTVLFDGLVALPSFGVLRGRVRDIVGPGLEAGAALYLVGLLVALAVVVTAIGLGEHLGRVDADILGAFRAFSPTVLPLAAANWVTHYYAWMLVSLDRVTDLIVPAIAGPYASLAPTLPDLAYAALAVPAFWGTRVAVVVFGFLVAVLTARGIAADRYESGRARRAGLPLVLVLLAYAAGSLWLLARPLAFG